MKARRLFKIIPGVILLLMMAMTPAVSAATVTHYSYTFKSSGYDPIYDLYFKGVTHMNFQMVDHGDGTVTVTLNQVVNAIFRNSDGILIGKYLAHILDHQNTKVGQFHVTFTHFWKVPGFGYLIQEWVVFNYANGEVRVWHTFP
ncbi:MAG: hypothetical protein ACFFDQ_11450 [Candidatus Thorarchaeota archaeon]